MKRRLLIATLLTLLCMATAFAQSNVRTVTGQFNKIGAAAPWAGAKITFKLERSTYTATNHFPPSEIVATTDALGRMGDGVCTLPDGPDADSNPDPCVSLWTNAEGLRPVQYRCVLPGGDSFLFYLAPGDPIAIGPLRAGATTEPSTSNQSVLQSIVDSHAAATDPHPVYLTQPEGDARYVPLGAGGVTDHGALTGLGDDDHPQYQLRAERNAANGYAGLDASALLPDNRLPASVARDSEVTAAVSAHEGSADPHPAYLNNARGDARYYTQTQLDIFLAAKAAAVHAHAIGDTTGLQAALDAKATISHSHVDTEIPNDITVNLATMATTATTANSGDSATAFFSTGTVEADRLGIGVNVQAWDADLDTWATKTPTTGAVVGTSDTQTLTNKTMDAEATGNVLTLPVKVWLPAAGCSNATAGSMWDLPTVTPAVAVCVTGTNTQKGALEFADTSGGFSAQNTLILPADFTGAIDARIVWTTTATTGNAKWSLSTVCTAADATETDDPAFNTASMVTTAPPGTASRVQTSSITGVIITGCAAGELMHVRVFRNGADASDTIAATARLLGVELTVRRAM